MVLLTYLNKMPQFLQKQMVFSIPLTMLLAFIVGINLNVTFLKFLIVPFTVLMVYPSMVTLNYAMLLKGGDAKLQWTTQVFNFAVIPLFAWLLGLWFFPNQVVLQLALFLTALLPTSGMTINWTNVAKGNLPSAVKMTVIGLILGSLTAPFYMKFVFGQSIEIPLSNTLKQIIVVIFIPMIIGFLTQKLIIKKAGQELFNKRVKPEIGPWGTIGVLGVIFSAIALKAKELSADPMIFLQLGLPILAFYLLNFALSSGFGRLFKNRADGIAFIYGTALRNLSIALAIVMVVPSLRDSHAALLISIGFIFQSQIAAWHVKYIECILPVKQSSITHLK